jgi:alkylhydroperoxidase family enzyme
MAEAQAGHSTDPKTAAALSFAIKVVGIRGHVSPAGVVELRNVGFDDEVIVEIVAHIALNLFTNYLNVALDVPVDFPGVKLTRAAA